jgi:hypothetical protein
MREWKMFAHVSIRLIICSDQKVSKRIGTAIQRHASMHMGWMMPTQVIKVEWCLLMACSASLRFARVIGYIKVGETQPALIISMLFWEGFKRQLAAGCMQWPWAIDSSKSRSIFRAKISRQPSFAPKDASSRPLRT